MTSVSTRSGRMVKLIVVLLVGWFAWLAVADPATAGGWVHQDDAIGGSADPAQQLVERFAPIVMTKDQADDCDPDGEPYRPSTVDIVFDNPEIALRQLGRENPVVTRAPTPSDVYGLGEGFFLDFPGSSLTPGCIYERDFWKYTADRPATIYAHIVQQPDEPELLVVQYWFYWYYNDWNNKHESDWEGISLLFEAGSIDEALASEPVATGYSQHEGGERADWDDPKLEREGDRPVVYSSAGSHASYYGSALYLGRAASEGFGCDNTDGPSSRVDADVVLLPDSVDDPDDPLAWLAYEGRWGERQNGSFNGPTGPIVKDRWLEPIPWFEELRDSSVVIPAGDDQGDSVINLFCGLVEAGSQALISFTVDPTRIVLAIAIVVLIVGFFVRRTRWERVAATPIQLRRRAGQIIRTSAGIYAQQPGVFLLFGLVYLPAVAFTGLFAGLVQLVPFVGDLLSLADGESGTNLLMALLVGSIANVAAFITVNAVVAEYLDRGDDGFDAAVAAFRRVKDFWRELATAFVRSFVIIFVLLMTFLGAPIAVWLLVRYQFVAQAVMFDEVGGKRAMRRSGQLVKGRWFHTAIVAAGLNGLVAISAAVVGLLLLVVASGLPLWLFSMLVSLVYAVIVPWAAIAMSLLYGDAVAEHEGAARASLAEVG